MDTATLILSLIVLGLIGGVFLWVIMGSNGNGRLSGGGSRDTTYVVDRPVWGGWGNWGGNWGRGWGGWGGRGRGGWYRQDTLNESQQQQQAPQEMEAGEVPDQQ